MTVKLTHSYSSLKQFDNCPRRYYYQRISKEVVDKGGEASLYGERVHKSFEDRLRDKTPLPKELAKHESLCVSIESLGKVTPEIELTLNADLKPTGWWDDDAWMRSKLDVEVTAGKSGVVLDWKTGKRRPDFFQLELCAAQMFIHYPELTKINTGFVWLQTGDLDKEVYTREDLGGILTKTIAKTKRIEEALEEDIWQPKPSPLCNWCPANQICEFAQRGRRR